MRWNFAEQRKGSTMLREHPCDHLDLGTIMYCLIIIHPYVTARDVTLGNAPVGLSASVTEGVIASSIGSHYSTAHYPSLPLCDTRFQSAS